MRHNKKSFVDNFASALRLTAYSHCLYLISRRLDTEASFLIPARTHPLRKKLEHLREKTREICGDVDVAAYSYPIKPRLLDSHFCDLCDSLPEEFRQEFDSDIDALVEKYTDMLRDIELSLPTGDAKADLLIPKGDDIE